MNPFINLIVTILSLYNWVVLVYLILSWLIQFKIVNRHQPVVSKLYEVLFRLTEPILSRIRSVLPDLNGIDLSPVVLLLGLYFIQNSLVYYFG